MSDFSGVPPAPHPRMLADLSPEEQAEFINQYTAVMTQLKSDVADPDKRLSLLDVAELTGFSKHTVNSWYYKGLKSRGHLPCVHVNRKRYSTVSAVEWYTGLPLAQRWAQLLNPEGDKTNE